jgi:starch-binding outer membrane protein, SusD/RagB family
MMQRRHFGWLAAAALLAACDSPLDTDPTASIDAGTALTTPRGIELGVTGAYEALQAGSLYSRDGVVYPDLYADNLDFTGTFQTDREVSLRNVPTSSGVVTGIWAAAYEGINRANNVLDAIPNVAELGAAEAAVYRGEALFIRALQYFTLVQWFDGVPVVTEPSRGVSEESNVERGTAADVFAQIESDLEEAATLLPTDRVNGRATRDAANALLARVYLETGEYADARDRATAVIESGNYELVDDYRTIFTTKNTDESIFELQYSINNTNSLAFWYFTQAEGGRWGFAPSADLIDAYEPGDDRLAASIATSDGDPFGIKYFRITNEDDNVIVLRLAEMYLIRAEANVRLGAAAPVVRADIDIVRARAGLDPLPATVTGTQALTDAILQERRVELAMEGHRFFDLRRLDRAVAVLSIPEHRLVFPIPQDERDVNPNLTQNAGY